MTKPRRGASFDSVVNRKTALPRTGVARAWRSAAARWKAASTASDCAGWGSARLGTAGAAFSSMDAMVTDTRAVRLPGGAVGASRAAAPSTLKGALPRTFESLRCLPFSSGTGRAPRALVKLQTPTLSGRSWHSRFGRRSLFERRDYQLTDGCNAALPPQYTAINCDSICLQYGVASARIGSKPKLCHKIALDIPRARIATSRCIVISSIGTSRYDATDCDTSPHKHS